MVVRVRAGAGGGNTLGRCTLVRWVVHGGLARVRCCSGVETEVCCKRAPASKRGGV